MKKPLVSAVIPTYNEEDYIGKCLESLNNQSYKKLEIIIVDDGSTDNTEKIIKKYKKVKLIKQNHKGPGLARNNGAKKSKGEILIFVDADMHFNKQFIEKLIEPMLKDKKLLGTKHEKEYATNIKNKWSYLWGEIRGVEGKAFRAIWKKKFFEMGAFDPKYGYADDQTFWLKYGHKPILAKGTVCYHINPETLKETYKQARWIGTFWKEKYFIFRVPIINYLTTTLLVLAYPFLVAAKVLKSKNKKISTSDELRFYSTKFWGYTIGVLRAVFLKKVYK